MGFVGGAAFGASRGGEAEVVAAFGAVAGFEAELEADVRNDQPGGEQGCASCQQPQGVLSIISPI